MGIAERLPFFPPKRRPLRLRRSGLDITAALVSSNDSLRAFGRDITAALVSTNYLFFYLLPVLGGTGSLFGDTGQYLVVLGHYWVVLVSSWW